MKHLIEEINGMENYVLLKNGNRYLGTIDNEWGWVNDKDKANPVNCNVVRNALALYTAARLALPWLGKMIADEGHLSAVAPSNAVKALRELEKAVLAAEGRES